MTKRDCIANLKMIRCIVETDCKGQEEVIDETIKMAIQALEENADLKEQFENLKNDYVCLQTNSMDVANDHIKMCEENEAMKASNQNLFDIIGKLKDENEKLKEEIQNLLKTCEECLAEQEPVSAVEVLKFMKDKFFTGMLDAFGCTTYQKIFEEYEPQEIVDKITEYENRTAEKSSVAEPVSYSDEFKVGDFVKVKGSYDVWKIICKTYVSDNMLQIMRVSDSYTMWMSVTEFEHAEPPKKETQVEWVWKAFSIGIIKYFEDENEAKNFCEEQAVETGSEYRYAMICRRRDKS